MTFLFIDPPSPTPIPIDDIPQEFREHLFDMFTHMFLALKQIVIPFTHVTLFQVLVGTIAVSAVTLALKLMYGKGGGSNKA